MDEAILTVSNLHTHFFTSEGTLKAVNGVSLELKRDSTLGIVGESGCGKTVTALSILQLVPWPGRVIEGEIRFEGRDIMELSQEEMRELRGKEIAIIFQDPTTGLNPVIQVGTQVEEMITSHLPVSKAEARQRAIVALRQTGLPAPERIFSQYPFQLSTGMCQRVMIAMAMALGPKVLIADEPTSALDVTTQAGILEEIRRLRGQIHSSILLITHDLGVVAQLADEVAVMYAGSIVESADVKTLFRHPTHPYTVALLEAMPRLDDAGKRLRTIRGRPPNPLELGEHCPFVPRCNRAMSQCRFGPKPELEPQGEEHWVACYHPVRYDWEN